MNTLLSNTRRWFVAGMVAVVAAGPIAGIASAAQARPAVATMTDKPSDKPGSKPGDSRPGREDAAKIVLANMFARQQREYMTVSGRVERAGKRADRVAKWVSEAQAKGKDVTAISAALDAFRGQLKTAQGSLGDAKALLDARAGFDANGKVTDMTAAKATVEGVAKKLQSTRETLRKAYQDLRKAIAAWRQANPRTPDPQVPTEE